MRFFRKDWREVYEAGDDMRRYDVLRCILKDSRDPSEISEIVDRMETLPDGLQSHIAWAVVYNPATTTEIFNRVKDNKGMLACTSSENVQSFWDKYHPCVSSI